MEISAVTTPVAAFVAGLVTSVHCVAMCGPLACSVRIQPARYHLTRVLAYGLAGALCGGLGSSMALLFKGQPARLAPWALAAVLLIIGLGLEKRLPQPRGFSRLMLRVRLDRSLGWLTPLIPCGPLWLMFGVAVVAGTWSGGALLLASFALGSIPLYALAQLQFVRLQGSLSPGALRWTQQALALFAAALLVWRATLPANAGCH